MSADRMPSANFKLLKEQVYEYLREVLRRGDLQPGSVIDIDKTSQRLGVSKTPLHEAILLLEMEGFVSILPRRKVVVNVLSLRDIRHIYDIIGSLESTALLRAFDLITDADIEMLARLTADMKEAIERDDFDLYQEKNLAFHNFILNSSENNLLIKAVNMFKKRLDEFPPQPSWIKEWEKSSLAEHVELVRLIRLRNRKRAVAYLRDVHWSYEVQEKFIVKYYTNTLPAAKG